MKRTLSLLLATLLILAMIPLGLLQASAANFNDINQSNVFVKQQTNYTCTLASAVMLVRRTAMMSGNSNWSSITESSMRSTAWDETGGLWWNFTYAGVSVGHGTLSSPSSSTLQSLLSSHPEGIVIYNSNHPHAVLLTDYTDGVFYCADPATEDGRQALSSCTLKGSGESGKISALTAYWYVKSPSVSLTDSHTLTILYNANGASMDCNQYVVSTGIGLNIRSSYSTSSSIVGVLDDNTTITVTETKPSGDYIWGKITHNSKTGWCALSYGSDVYAYPLFYLNSSLVSLTSGEKNFTQTMMCGMAKDLYNCTTFGLKKDGYTFVGWSRSADGSTTIFDPDDATLTPEAICPEVKDKDCSVTLYAIWRPSVLTTVHITLDANGGTVGTKDFYYQVGNNKFYSDAACTDEITQIILPTRLGYQFVHYYGDGSCGGVAYERFIYGYESPKDMIGTFAFDLADDITRDATLYAKWTPCVSGDLDGNSEITDEDAIYLLMYTFFPDEYLILDPMACDYNKDGVVTDEDAIWLLLYTFFPDEYPIA